MPHDVVRIDGAPPLGWHFVRFEVHRGESDVYVGVVAQFVGERHDDIGGDCVVESRPPGEWLRLYDADEFVQRAIKELQ